MYQSNSFLITEFGQVGEARRHALYMAENLSFGEVESGRVGIVVTELANNLVKHAGGGEIVLHAIASGDVRGIEIISLDKGQGMDINRCLKDGYSTAGSPGTGLGAISRLSDEFEIYSSHQNGTVIVTSLWQEKRQHAASRFECGVICRPIEGEKECGDGWSLRQEEGRIRMMVVDGLGHGQIAAKAANAAIAAFEEARDQPLTQLIQLLHGSLLSTRGAAMALADIDYRKNELSFVGVGNISGTIIAEGKTKGLASYNGTVGHQMHKVKEFVYPCPADALILLHTDGISYKWKLEDYPGLSTRAPSLISSVIYRDFQRQRDDSTMLTLKLKEK